MDAVWAAASYSRGGFSLCLAGSVRSVMVSGESTFQLEVRSTGDLEQYNHNTHFGTFINLAMNS